MKKETVLVTGGSGLVGSTFIEAVTGEKKNNLVFESKIGILVCPKHEDLDIIDFSAVKKFVDKYKPQTIINFAAHRNANTAEEQRNDKNGSAWKSNVDGVANIARVAKRNGIYVIHISTDMVFSGKEENKGPYDEDHKTENNLTRLTWYGWTKAMGEKEIEESGIESSIVRIANVVKPIFDPSLDYVGKIHWLSLAQKLYPVFDDQLATLSYLPELTEAIQRLVEKKYSGIFHIASSNIFTPYELTRYLYAKLGLDESKIKKISIDEYLSLNPNRYPKYGGLKSGLTCQKLGLKKLTWQEIVDNYYHSVKR